MGVVQVLIMFFTDNKNQYVVILISTEGENHSNSPQSICVAIKQPSAVSQMSTSDTCLNAAWDTAIVQLEWHLMEESTS